MSASRRALCIGVGSFGVVSGEDWEEPDLTQFGDLNYAVQYTRELHAALRAATYDVTLLVEPDALHAAQLGERVEQHLTGAGVAVVHVLSHGDYVDAGGVFVVGSDGVRARRTRVEDWRIQVASDPAAPTTLFLLDLCHAGAANRYWQPPTSGVQERAWVIAAAGADQPAYAGRLTRAAAQVIEEITSGRADLDPALPWVAFDTLFERVRLRMRQLALDEDGNLQDPVCTPVMGAQPQLQFFANPDYRPSPAGEAAAAVEPATARFVDPVLDEEHFRERAAGRGPAGQRISGSGFAGRAPQLRQLAAWMDGLDDSDLDTGLVVVTGSPGVGKSALLGVLVCAAHPQLREPTRELWRAAAARPSENAHLAAVHARQRTLAEITASLGRQLLGSDGALYPGPDFYPGEDVVPTAARTPDQLVIAIAQLRSPPVIVLDALDEALGAGQIIERLLIPLARSRRPDGSPGCRLLVGTRPWAEFAPLLGLAQQSGVVLDLDAIPAEQRRADLAEYVAGLLELLPGYASTAHSRGRRAFAGAVATALVDTGDPPASSGGPPARWSDERELRWGEFLVAALYTHAMTLTDPARLTDLATAVSLGAQAPRTLPSVLELDLDTRPEPPWQGALLSVLARARGAGIPRAVLPAVLAALTGHPDPPSINPIAAEL